MNHPYVYIVVAVVLLALGAYGTFSLGSGGFKRLTTISGVYTVENPGNFPVVCFVEKSSGSMQCLTRKSMWRLPIRVR